MKITICATTDINSITCIADSSDTCQVFPLDCIPVEKKETFINNYKHHIPQQVPQRQKHFDDYIQMQKEWVKKMISHYRQNVLEESLLTHIHLKSSLLIATDGAKGKKKSGRGWVIALDNGHHLIEGYSPNFGQSNKITSYRSEAYAVLSAILFLHHYCNFLV